MKKILGTTLIAVAFAMVNTVDAKVVNRGQKGAVTVAQNVAEAAVEAVDSSKSSPKDVKAAQNSAGDVLSAENLSADEREYAVSAFRLQDIKNTIAFRKKQIEDLKLGWFGGLFSATKDQREERDRLNQMISDLENDKKQIESDMATLKPVVGSRFVKAVQLMALGVVVTMTAAFINDYLEGGLRKKAGEIYEYGKTQVGEVVAAGKRKLGYGEATVATPTVQEPTTTEQEGFIARMRRRHHENMKPKTKK